MKKELCNNGQSAHVVKGFYEAPYNFSNVQKLYEDIEKLCQPDAYNLVLHKHLGDVFYTIAYHKAFEKKYGAKLHFIVQPQHEFLMKMYGVRNYSVCDLRSYYPKIFEENHYNYIPHFASSTHFVDMMLKSYFPAFPLLRRPFVVDSCMTDFFLFDTYWSRIWGINLGLAEDFCFFMPPYAPTLSAKVQNKVAKIAPLEKIVLIAPESSTAVELPLKFWNIIADHLHQKGYKILVNSKRYNINHGVSVYDLDLTLEDVVSLGLQCAFVFSVRTGLCDVLVGAREKLFAFYPAMLRREVGSLSKVFVEETKVNEIALYDWKIDPVVVEDANLTPALQKFVCQQKRRFLRMKLMDFLLNKRKNFKKRILNDIMGVSRLFPENNKENPLQKRNKIFGFNWLWFYKKTHKQDPDKTWKTKSSWLNGLFWYSKHHGRIIKMHILGLGVYSRKVNRYITTKFLGIPLKKKDLKPAFLARLTSALELPYDDIYIIRHNIGETYLYLAKMADWIKKNGSKKPLILIWRKKDVALYKMFLPKGINCQFIAMSSVEINTFLTDECTRIGKKRIFCPTPDIAKNMKARLANSPEINFYTYIMESMSLPGSTPLNQPKVNSQTVCAVENIIKELQLGEKFVLMIPEATTLTGLPNAFWQELINRLTDKGYKVFVNQYNSKIAFEGVTFENINIAEIVALAKKADGVIGLASGLSVLLSAVSKKMDLMYTDYVDSKTGYDAEMAIKMYSLFHLPDVFEKTVAEYNTKKISRDDLIDQIISRY